MIQQKNPSPLEGERQKNQALSATKKKKMLMKSNVR